jgi:hypothetical protein
MGMVEEGRETAPLEELDLNRKFHPGLTEEGGADAYVEAFPTRNPSNHPMKSDQIWYFRGSARSDLVFHWNRRCLRQLGHDPVAE